MDRDAIQRSFPADYFDAREKFCGAARRAGARVQRFDCPVAGPGGEALSTDVAWVGSKESRKVLVVISGTHGVEGFCGSGLQVDWLIRRGASALPPDCAVLMIHAINPFGFAWIRRVNEDGVDLNRNFMNPAQPTCENPGYAELADALVPRELSGPIFVAAEETLQACRARIGELAFFRAVASGQYTHPQGLFFGGFGPTWSNRITHEIIATHLQDCSDVAVVDFHTGLGPFGYGDVMTDYPPESDGSQRVRDFWGDSVTEMQKGQTLPLVKDGATPHAYIRALPRARVTVGILEFGTYDRENGRRALRADHWLHAYGDPLGPQAPAIKQALKRQYFPDTLDWKESVLFRGHQVVRMALEGLDGARAERGQPIPQ